MTPTVQSDCSVSWLSHTRGCHGRRVKKGTLKNPELVKGKIKQTPVENSLWGGIFLTHGHMVFSPTLRQVGQMQRFPSSKTHLRGPRPYELAESSNLVVKREVVFSKKNGTTKLRGKEKQTEHQENPMKNLGSPQTKGKRRSLICHGLSQQSH